MHFDGILSGKSRQDRMMRTSGADRFEPCPGQDRPFNEQTDAIHFCHLRSLTSAQGRGLTTGGLCWRTRAATQSPARSGASPAQPLNEALLFPASLQCVVQVCRKSINTTQSSFYFRRIFICV